MEYVNSKPAKSFQDLRVWQVAYLMTLDIYRLTGRFPDYEKFGLASQMTRAAVSVCSNIAEGFGRRSAKEKDQFYSIANGSMTELENQLLIAHGIGYISKEELVAVTEKCEAAHKMLAVLQKVNRQ